MQTPKQLESQNYILQIWSNSSSEDKNKYGQTQSAPDLLNKNWKEISNMHKCVGKLLCGAWKITHTQSNIRMMSMVSALWHVYFFLLFFFAWVGLVQLRLAFLCSLIVLDFFVCSVFASFRLDFGSGILNEK